jgi:hypothetical protein
MHMNDAVDNTTRAPPIDLQVFIAAERMYLRTFPQNRVEAKKGVYQDLSFAAPVYKASAGK